MRLLALLALSLPGMAAAGTAETNKKLWDGARRGDISMVRDALGAGAVGDYRTRAEGQWKGIASHVSS